MTHEDIQKLGFLARIEVSEAEGKRLAEDMANILNFLKQIENVSTDDIVSTHRLKNVTRPDENPYERGQFSAELLQEAPEVSNGFIQVKKIL